MPATWALRGRATAGSCSSTPTRRARRVARCVFRAPRCATVGALAGEVVPAPGGRTLAARYGAERSFLRQEAHLAHPYRPRAVAANLLVRRAAFEQVGGFYEGVRAAEDTDFCWRLQEAGWALEIRPGARVEHRYRASLRELRRQWRGYAAGRAWLSRRYAGFEPEPAVVRALSRATHRGGHASASVSQAPPPASGQPRRGTRHRHRRRRRSVGSSAPASSPSMRCSPAMSSPASPCRIVPPMTGRHRRAWCWSPTASRPRATPSSSSRSPSRARGSRQRRDRRWWRRPDVRCGSTIREDDGVASRLSAVVRLTARHPVRALRDVTGRGARGPSLTALAPAVLRLARDRGARVQPLGGARAGSTARRLAALAGRPLHDPGAP